MKEQRWVRAAIALALLIVAAGCGNRNGSLVGYRPEGNVNAAIMVVQVDTTHGGTLAATATVYMQSPANRVRLYDDVNSKGFVPNDALNEPVRVLSSGWGLYRISVTPYDPSANHTLLARGSRDGQESVISPLSNPAAIPAGALNLLASRDTLPLAPRAPVVNADAAPATKIDSLYFNVGAVAEAQSIYLEVVKSAVTQYLVLFQRQGGVFVRTLEFENIPPALGQTYTWQVDEYDSGARLIAATTVPGSFVVEPPLVNGAPLIWPTTPDHYIFVDNWTIPGFIARLHPTR